MRTYRQLFAVPEFRVLFLAVCLNVGSNSVGSLALGTITYAQTGSPLLTGLSMFGGPLVRLVASWFLLSLSDLIRPRQALMIAAAAGLVADALQAIPGLAWQWRFVLLALPWIVMSATGGSLMALVSDILPSDAFVFGRATMNVAVGVMQIVGYGVAGLLLLAFTTTELFLGAAAASLVVLVVVRLGLADHPPRATGNVTARSGAVNRLLLGSPVLRPVYLALWVPNGMIVGCEALFVPYAGHRAGFLFAAAGAGMLTGDVAMGRFVPASYRDLLVEPMRLLLAVPYLLFWLDPGLALACVLSYVASIGYCASLPLQERLVTRTGPDIRGQVLGLNGLGLLSFQGIGAIAAGAVASLLGDGGTGHAAGIMAAVSVLITLSLTPGLRRSRADAPVEVVRLPGSRGSSPELLAPQPATSARRRAR